MHADITHKSTAPVAPRQLLLLPENKDGKTIQEQFEAFHALNPWVADSLIELARTYRRMGRRRIGIKHLIEILRWDYARATQGDDFRLNNNWTSRYARLIVGMAPDIADMFETRRLRS